MMDSPLLISSLLDQAAQNHADTEIVSRTVEGPDRDGAAATREEPIRFYDGKVARWWIPDDVTFVEQLPHTATGKLLKTKLRQELKDYELPK